MIQLTGQALLNYRDACRAAGVNAAGIVRSAGYVGQRKDGSERLNYVRYYEEVLIAQGKMHRIRVITADQTHTFNTFNKSARSVALKVRKLTNLTNVRCKRTVHDGVVRLYPKNGEVVTYNIPA